MTKLTSSPGGQTCEAKIKNFVPSTREVANDRVSRLGRVVKTANWSTRDGINFRYFGGEISPLYPSKTECVVHRTAERETTGLKLWVQREILSKYYFCVQIRLFSKCVWPPNLPKVSYLVSYYNTVGQIYQNSLRSRLNSPGWDKTTTLNVQESLFGKLPIPGASCPYIQRHKLLSPNFHTNSLYFNHSSPHILLYYAWVTCDYISRKISPRNWFECFPVYPRIRFRFRFRIPDCRVFHTS